MSARDVIRKVLPPRFRCATCQGVFPKTVFDLPEADGSYICQACEVAANHWHREHNPHLTFADGYDR